MRLLLPSLNEKFKKNRVLFMQIPNRFFVRDKSSHKYDFGHACIVGGSHGMIGSVCLAAFACLRAGAGLITACVPEEIYSLVAGKIIHEAMVFPLSSQKGMISGAAFPKFQRFYEAKIDVVGLGVGLGQSPGSLAFCRKVIQQIRKPLVLDADGINLVAQDTDLLRFHKGPLVLTPHLGEFSRLLGRKKESIMQQRKKLAQDFALRYNLVLVLKGHQTLVTDGKRVFENITGNPGMATAGSGDVLCGVITALLAQKMSSFEASVLGVYLHGLSGDLAKQQCTETGLMASDIIHFFPLALKKARKEKVILSTCRRSSAGRAADL